MISYVFQNSASGADIARKAKRLYGLKTIDTDGGIILGSDKMMIDIGRRFVRIILFERDMNIRELKLFITGKTKDDKHRRKSKR